MIVAVGGWRGSGATTAALLLATALAETGPTWCVEADPAGGVLAGRMQLAPHSVGGLERVAFPTERTAPREVLAAVSHVSGQRRIVTAPADPFRAHACHSPRRPWVASLRDLDGTVVVDCGRLRCATPAWPLLAIADVVLLVTSPEVSAAVSAADWQSTGGRMSPDDAGVATAMVRVVFVAAPSGVSFAQADALGELGSRCAGWLPWDAATVDRVHRGATFADRRVRRSNLAVSVGAVASAVVAGEAAPLRMGRR